MLAGVREWLEQPTTQAGGLVAIGLVFTVLIAVLGGSAKASAIVLLLLALLAGVFQVLGASKYHTKGKVDPSHARSSVQRLVARAARAHEVRVAVEQAYAETGTDEARLSLGRISVELSILEEGLVEGVGLTP